MFQSFSVLILLINWLNLVDLEVHIYSHCKGIERGGYMIEIGIVYLCVCVCVSMCVFLLFFHSLLHFLNFGHYIKVTPVHIE